MSHSVKISVVICTHNPRLDYLARVLDALARQTLSANLWKLIIVDNASSPALDLRDVAHSGLQPLLLTEPLPGKVHAMVSASRETEGDWIIFVDDDNVLDSDYLMSLLLLSEEFPRIGVCSSSIRGEFEKEVPDWAVEYLSYLAIRPLKCAVWGNITGAHIGPIGAGMAIRRKVYEAFVSDYRDGKIQAHLGRTVGSLTAGTDDTIFMDIAFREGLGCGAFPELQMTHLIAALRLTPCYMQKLVHDVTKSHALLAAARGEGKSLAAFLRIIKAFVWCALLLSGQTRRIALARCSGQFSAFIHNA